MFQVRWRTVDIVVASILAVTFGVIFWAWNQLWIGPFSTAFAGFPPAAGLVNGVWLIPVALAPLIIRKPGAALFVEFVASTISLLLPGATFGWSLILYGLFQGVAGEIAFAIFRYRRYTAGVAMLATFFAALAGTFLDLLWPNVWGYGDMKASWQLAYAACQTLSGIVIGGIGAFYLTKALAGTGVLDRFPSGRTRELV